LKSVYYLIHLKTAVLSNDVLKLCRRYQHFLDDSGNSDALSTSQAVSSQYQNFRFVVSEKLKAGLLRTFSDVVLYAHQEEQEYASLTRLLDICATFQASSADCERGFSLMNAIKTKSRNRLESDHLEMLMRIKSYQCMGRTVNLDKVYQSWSLQKDRRQKL
jgi:hypothetical protein